MDRISRIHDKVVRDELKNNPRYHGDIYVYMLTEPVRPRLYRFAELETFSDEQLVQYFKGEHVLAAGENDE